MEFNQLRYVAAGRVDVQSLDLTRFFVESEDARPVGRLSGFLIDPVARQLRYLVVESRRFLGTARRLVPFTSAQVDAERGALKIDLSSRAFADAARFDPSAVPEYRG